MLKKMRQKEREKCQFVTMFTSPSTTYSCPIIYVFWCDLPFFPPHQDLEALELPTDEDIHLDFIKDYLKSFINLYYSTLHLFTTPLEPKE